MFLPYFPVNVLESLPLYSILFYFPDKITVCRMCILSDFHMVCRNIPLSEHCSLAFLILLWTHFLSFIGWYMPRLKLSCKTGIDTMISLIGFHLPDADCSSPILPVYRLHQFCGAFTFGNTFNILSHSIRIF